VKRKAMIVVLVLGLLCLAASRSSHAPDAVQSLLGLPGGADSFLKAAGGILVTVSLIYLLGGVLKRLKSSS
jgi:hypothetical protein